MSEGARIKADTGVSWRESMVSAAGPAPLPLRCGALLIDYIVIVGAFAVSTIFARILGGGARTAGLTAETIGYVLTASVAFFNLALLPMWRGQTVGKWATGLRIERRGDRSRLGLGRALLRHLVGYPLSMILFGGGYLLAVFNQRGLALHDLIAQTIVTRNLRRSPPRRGRS